MAHGAPGRVLTLAAAGALELDDAAAALLASRGGAQADAEALRLADRLRGGEGAQTFGLLLDRLSERMHASATGASSAAAADAWAGLWRRTSALPGRVEALNLDRADAFWSLLAEVRDTVRRADARAC